MMIVLGIFFLVVATHGVPSEQDPSIQCLFHVGSQFNNLHRRPKTIFHIIHDSVDFVSCSGIVTPHSPVLQEIRAHCHEMGGRGKKLSLPLSDNMQKRIRTACFNLFYPSDRLCNGNAKYIQVASAYLESAGDALDEKTTTRHQVKQYVHVFSDNVRTSINEQCVALRPSNPKRLAAPGNYHACRVILSDSDENQAGPLEK